MKIAVLGPCDLNLLEDYLFTPSEAPPTYSFSYISRLVVAYLNRGHEVVVVTSSEHLWEPMRLAGEGLDVVVVPRRRSARARGLDLFAREIEWVRLAVEAERPDVIHAHWIYEFGAAALRVQADALITAHDGPISVVRHYGTHPYWWLREMLGIRTLRKARNITAVAPSLAREVQLFCARHAAVSVLPNGLDNPISPSGWSRAIRRDKQPVLAVVANGFDRRKNSRTAIRAFARVRAAVPGSEMHLFGQGHEPDGPAAVWAREKCISKGLHFEGPVENKTIQSFLKNQIDILVHPSRWEACSLAILEARSFGVPIVASRKAGGVSYTLDEGESGYLVSGSVNSYFIAMMRLIGEQVLYAKISGSADSELSPRFDLGAVTDQYLELLNSIKDARH